jgi:hypothetical protein
VHDSVRANTRHRTLHELRAVVWQVCERDAAERRQCGMRYVYAVHAVAARAAGGDAVAAVAQLRHAAHTAQQRPRRRAGAQQPRRKHGRTRCYSGMCPSYAIRGNALGRKLEEGRAQLRPVHLNLHSGAWGNGLRH